MMSLTLQAPEADITLLFSGKRQDASADASDFDNASRGPQDVGNQTASIALADPGTNDMPLFTFANGSGFSWHHDSEHRWHATSGKSSESASSKPEQLGWIMLAAYFGCMGWLIGA